MAADGTVAICCHKVEDADAMSRIRMREVMRNQHLTTSVRDADMANLLAVGETGS